MPHLPVVEILEEDLFGAALALPAPERMRYLKRACGFNIAQFERLNSLLSVFSSAASFVSGSEAITGCEDRIGHYKVLQELGEGGCGVVYRADQIAPVKRQVALKIIKLGMDTKAVITRFDAERQVLALLDHPNIAKVFDAGTTPEGRPYFVMELVRGIRITEYCAQSRLSLHERLLLFIQVCQAIQHAHQKGIIHRDIKPSNVLVTMHDGVALAKVIDFGIAKATQGRLIDETLHTEIDQIMGTPAYISPEQTQPTRAAVDTRSDIYGLGVLLYELLTGGTPFDAQELAEVGIEQLRERICTEEPARPSRRLRSFDEESLTRIASTYATTSLKLVKQIEDDLDWIVMQCLEKEQARRYQAVNELVADLDRYLRHAPVLARPPTFIYTVRKLALRNRIAFVSALAAAAFLVFVTAFAVTVTLQAHQIAAERNRAELERQQAQRVSNVVLNLFGIADPFQSLGSNFTGSALLEQAAESIEHELQDQPVARAKLLQAVGRAYARRGEFKSSVRYQRDALDVLRRIDRADGETLSAMIDLAYALRIAGDAQGAHQMLALAEDRAKRSGLDRSEAYAKLCLNRARTLWLEGQISEAHAELARSLQLYEKTVGSQSAEVAEVLGELAQLFLWKDKYAEAERTARQAIAMFEATVPSLHPDRVRTELVLAEALYVQDRLEEAASILVDALTKDTQLFGYRSPQVGEVLDRLAVVRYSQGRFSESEAVSREAMETARVTYGNKHIMTGSIATTLARTLIRRRNYREAEATLREALEIFAASIPADHQYIASAEYFLGEVLLTRGRLSEAEAVLTASMRRWERSGAPSWRAMRSANALGEVLYLQGRIREGKNHLSESYAGLTAEANPDTEAREMARYRYRRYMGKALPLKGQAPAPVRPATQ